jgi:hypothetical protein
VREERVFLEDEPDTALVGLAEESSVAVQPDVAVECDPPPRWGGEPGDRLEHRGLACTRRPDQRDRPVDLER